MAKLALTVQFDPEKNAEPLATWGDLTTELGRSIDRNFFRESTPRVGDHGLLFDVNGNTAGKWEVSDGTLLA